MTDQDHDHMKINPYQSTLSESTKPLKGIRWFRRFAILNSVFLLVPAVCALAAYFVLAANAIWLSGVSGVMEMELAILVVAYLAIPNFIMIALWLRFRRSSRHQNGGNGLACRLFPPQTPAWQLRAYPRLDQVHHWESSRYLLVTDSHSQAAITPNPCATGVLLDPKTVDSCATGVLQTSEPFGKDSQQNNENTRENEKSQVSLALSSGGGGN